MPFPSTQAASFPINYHVQMRGDDRAWRDIRKYAKLDTARNAASEIAGRAGPNNPVRIVSYRNRSCVCELEARYVQLPNCTTHLAIMLKPEGDPTL